MNRALRNKTLHKKKERFSMIKLFYLNLFHPLDNIHFDKASPSNTSQYLEAKMCKYSGIFCGLSTDINS